MYKYSRISKGSPARGQATLTRQSESGRGFTWHVWGSQGPSGRVRAQRCNSQRPRSALGQGLTAVHVREGVGAEEGDPLFTCLRFICRQIHYIKASIYSITPTWPGSMCARAPGPSLTAKARGSGPSFSIY